MVNSRSRNRIWGIFSTETKSRGPQGIKQARLRESRSTKSLLTWMTFTRYRWIMTLATRKRRMRNTKRMEAGLQGQGAEATHRMLIREQGALRHLSLTWVPYLLTPLDHSTSHLRCPQSLTRRISVPPRNLRKLPQGQRTAQQIGRPKYSCSRPHQFSHMQPQLFHHLPVVSKATNRNFINSHIILDFNRLESKDQAHESWQAKDCSQGL